MSQIKKSASFRSRIPVRRTSRLQQRRCSSPQLLLATSSSTSRIRNKTTASHKIFHERYYSSSSYSSSDESSHDQEEPIQMLLKKSTVIDKSTLPNDPADAMSLNGFLDNVSCENLSSPHSPQMRIGRLPLHPDDKFMEQQGNVVLGVHSSYESLDKFNSTSETLKITDDYHLNKQNIISNMNRNISSEYIHNSNNNNSNSINHIAVEIQNMLPNNQNNTNNINNNRNNYKLMNSIDYNSSLKKNKESNVINYDPNGGIDDEIEAAMNKQKHLSDWYYIKSSPKPKPTSPYERRKVNKNLSSSNQKIGLPMQPPLLQHNGSFDRQNSSTDQINYISENSFVPLQKYRSNDYIDPSSQVSEYIEEKSPLNTYKCFSMKYSKNPSGKLNDMSKFGEFTSSSFEHVNVTGLYDNRYSESDIRNEDYVQSLRLAAAKMRPLPQVPVMNKQQILQHYPTKTPQPKQSQATTPSSYRTELSGSYASLDCPSPPGPPILSDKTRDPQTRLAIYLKTLYIDLSLKEPILPSWVHPVIPGTLCPARLEPELRLSSLSHGLNECISIDQILTAVHTKDGPYLEAPRRIFIECPSWLVKSSLALRILHNWARDAPWPQRGQPVALALFVPLSELKGTLHNYISKELISKNPPNLFSGFGVFNSAWNTLESLKGKLLFILDSYDATLTRSSGRNRKNKSIYDDIIDLLEGKLFPESRIILIGSSSQCVDLLPLMQRHLKYEGITWGRSASLLGGGQWGAPTRLLDIVQSSIYLRNSVRTPLGCLAVASMYETNGGQLPTEEIDVIEGIINCIAPGIPQSHIAELGRLALFCLKTKRSVFSTAEIRMYCSAPESPVIGCFEKCPLFGKTAKKKGEYYYAPICQGIFEFLAANYLVSLANRPGLLAAEITGLSLADEVEADILKVLKFSMTLLGNRAHVLLSKLTTLWLSPQTVFSLALAGGETEANLNALSDMLGISKVPPISPLETNPIWVSITSSINELQGWGLALKSPVCALKNLELMYQMEKTIQLESRNALDIFLDALSRNESVTTLRISSLIENDVRENDINHLAACISKALLKPRLENFELILTLLEEDPPAMKLQSVVSALCKSIPRQTKLVSVLLDLGLCTSQLVQICAALERCPHINRLSLPHLRCERGAISALASLLKNRPLSSLALPACWGARDDPPSSSGVSMGSGSGSSSGNSGLIKQGSLTGAPSPRAYPPGLFSSLPRGLPPTATLGRSQTLPRQLLEGPPDKRSQDSVVSRTWYPTPACEGGPHNSGTLHDLLFAAREPYSRLHGLDLSKAQLSLEDSMCLGETVRISPTLHSIKLEGASRLSEILPTVLGAAESPSLQMLSLGSPRLILEDTAITMSARALGSCITLRLLSLDGWSFKFENLSTLAQVRGFLSLTSIRELGLSNCRIYLPMFHSVLQMPSDAYDCHSIVVLKLSGTQIILGDQTPLRGPQLLPYLGGFHNLRELDLSAPARSGLGSTTSAPPLILDDKGLTTFFQQINLKFGLLNTLKICNWIIHLDDATKTFKAMAKALKSSTISHIKIDGISVLDRNKKHRVEPQFLQTLLSSIPLLRWISVSLSGVSEEQMAFIGNSIGDIKSNEIDIRLSDSTIENVRLMTQSLSLDGKFDIRVSTFGTSSNILVHVEKVGVKSLSRKHKD